MYTKAKFASQFKSLIEAKGLTQRTVADKLNTTETTISRYASGTRTPNIETAVDIAEILGVSLDTLCGVKPPVAAKPSPEISILIECYTKANDADRQVLWSLLDRYMTPEERIIIASVDRKQQIDAG